MTNLTLKAVIVCLTIKLEKLAHYLLREEIAFKKHQRRKMHERKDWQTPSKTVISYKYALF
jgi:hypothetical protein